MPVQSFPYSQLSLTMREAVKEVLPIIRAQRGSFTATKKPPYPGKAGDDVTTSADTDAQAHFARRFRQDYPWLGIIAEEHTMRVPCQFEGEGLNAYITIDPLDGSKAYERREAFGIATMISLVVNGEVIAAFVGDVNSGDVYAYTILYDRRPSDGDVCRVFDTYAKPAARTFTNLSQLPRDTPLTKGYVLLREEREDHHPLLAAVARSTTHGGIFKSYETVSGSVGLSMARLWCDQVVAHCMTPGPRTPWDTTPVVGMSQQLGMVWLRPNGAGNAFEEYKPDLLTEITYCPHDTIVMHRSRVPAFHKAVHHVVNA